MIAFINILVQGKVFNMIIAALLSITLPDCNARAVGGMREGCWGRQYDFDSGKTREYQRRCGESRAMARHSGGGTPRDTKQRRSNLRQNNKNGKDLIISASSKQPLTDPAAQRNELHTALGNQSRTM